VNCAVILCVCVCVCVCVCGGGALPDDGDLSLKHVEGLQFVYNMQFKHEPIMVHYTTAGIELIILKLSGSSSFFNIR
jgi:hypothetical protein